MHQTWNRCSNRQWLSPRPELLYIHSCLKAFSTSRSGQPCCCDNTFQMLFPLEWDYQLLSVIVCSGGNWGGWSEALTVEWKENYHNRAGEMSWPTNLVLQDDTCLVQMSTNVMGFFFVKVKIVMQNWSFPLIVNLIAVAISVKILTLWCFRPNSCFSNCRVNAALMWQVRFCLVIFATRDGA